MVVGEIEGGTEVGVEIVVETGAEVEVEVGAVGVEHQLKVEKSMAKVIEISDETYEKIKDQLPEWEKGDISALDDLVGKAWFFRTVTYHLVGKVEKVFGKIAQLSTASWVADSGRFMQAIQEGKLSEVEPVGVAYVNLDTVTDFFPWKHKLPTDQK